MRNYKYQSHSIPPFQIARKGWFGLVLSFTFFFTTQFTTAQHSKLQIENITFPEGNQLAYAYHIEQDNSGLIWISANWNYYHYNGHTLSKVESDGLGFNSNRSSAMFGEKGYPYFQTIDASFACFQDIEDRWQELHDLYRSEIEQGVSRGRFTAMLDQMSLSLRESHTALTHEPVHKLNFWLASF